MGAHGRVRLSREHENPSSLAFAYSQRRLERKARPNRSGRSPAEIIVLAALVLVLGYFIKSFIPVLDQFIPF